MENNVLLRQLITQTMSIQLHILLSLNKWQTFHKVVIRLIIRKESLKFKIVKMA